jgi:PTS system nitrogen regulatory IIA component
MSWFEKKAEASPAAPKSGLGTVKPQGLKIGPLLSEDVILFLAGPLDKPAIMAQLTAAVCRKAGVADPSPFAARAAERERGISTTLDTGLSLPHARMDGIDAILAGLAVLKTPIADPAQADLTIRVVFLFFSPNRKESFPVHLQLLRGVSSLFQPAMIDRLTAAPGPAEALALVRSLEG